MKADVYAEDSSNFVKADRHELDEDIFSDQFYAQTSVLEWTASNWNSTGCRLTTRIHAPLDEHRNAFR
jgi:hypothetical protein